MRIIIAAPPKAGNSWLRCLFSVLYDLESLRDAPERGDPASLAAWAAAGRFPDGSVFHRHYDYSPALADAAAAIPAHLATILRDPYDQFVSLYFFLQTQAAAGHKAARDAGRGATSMIGKPIDHPDVLAYLAGGFGRSLRKGVAWLESDRSVVLRYEGLHADPVAELARAAERIAPAPPGRVAAAVAACRAATLLASRPGRATRLRAATVGDWRNHLTEAHLAVVRAEHADLVRRLGYEVR